jgi:TonB family protein
VTVGRDGRVAEARPVVFTASGAVRDIAPTAGAMAGAAVDAVERWQYEPTGKGAVTFTINVVMRPGGSPESAAIEDPIKTKDSALKTTKKVDPRYPAAASQQGIQGVIVVDATVARDGRVVDARVLRDIPYLGQAALDAVAEWEFDPSTLFAGSDAPIRTIELTINFTLRR